MQALADRGFEFVLVLLRLPHAVLAASVIAHLAVIGWLMFPEPSEKLAAPDRFFVCPMLPSDKLQPQYCPVTTWVEHRSGCVVIRKRVCSSPSVLGRDLDREPERPACARERIDPARELLLRYR